MTISTNREQTGTANDTDLSEHMPHGHGRRATETMGEAPRSNVTLSRPDAVAGPALNALYYGLMGLLSLAFLVLSIIALRAWTTGSRSLYDAQCPALSLSSKTTRVCTVVQTQVVDHQSKQVWNYTVYWLTVRLSDGRSIPVKISDRDAWNAASPGTTVVIQMWKGKATAVLINGKAIQTYDNPDVAAASNATELAVNSVFLLLGIVGILLPRFNRQCATARFKRSTVVLLFVLGTPVLLRLLT